MCRNERLYRAPIILNRVFMDALCKQTFTFFNHGKKKPNILRDPLGWLNTHSVMSCQQVLVSVYHKASVCTYAAICLSGLQERGNQLFPMMSLYSLISMACTNKHTDIYIHTWVWVSLMLWMWGNISRLSFLWTDFNEPRWTPTPNTWKRNS